MKIYKQLNKSNVLKLILNHNKKVFSTSLIEDVKTIDQKLKRCTLKWLEFTNSSAVKNFQWNGNIYNHVAAGIWLIVYEWHHYISIIKLILTI